MGEDGDDWYYDDGAGGVGVDDGTGNLDGGEAPIDNGDGTYTDPITGEISDVNGFYLGQDNGDGTWTDAYGTVYDAEGNIMGAAPIDVGNLGLSGQNGGGFWDAVKNFFGGGGSGGGNMGGGAGGGFGGGGSGSQQQANQLANQLAQQLAHAQQTGAPAATIAQLQSQLALARQMAAAAGSGDSTKLILIAAVLGLGVYAFTSSRRE